MQHGNARCYGNDNDQAQASNIFIYTEGLCLTLSIVLVIFKIHDVLETVIASVIRCEAWGGKGDNKFDPLEGASLNQWTSSCCWAHPNSSPNPLI
jgi:hypothetical protein